MCAAKRSASRGKLFNFLTPVEREWGALVVQGVSYRKAAIECGLDPRNSGRLAAKPAMVEYLEELRKRIYDSDGHRVSAAAAITRAEVLDELAALARMHVDAIGAAAKVSALMGLAKIMGMLIDRNLNLDEFFRGWSDEELEKYAVTGHLPQRLTTGESQDVVGSQTA